MKKLILCLTALWVLSGGALLAQNVAGTWQGALKAGPPGQTREIRIAIKIARADDESLKATLYNVDQAAPGLNATAVTLRGSALKMTIAPISGTYEATLSADSNSLTGTFTQAGTAMPLNMARATPETAWAIPDPPPPVVPMAADASPSFEVATIKPSKPNTPGKFIGGGRNFSTLNTTLSDLMTFAYGIHPKQIVGAPAWIEEEKYDLGGEPDVKGQPSLNQTRVMLQKLIEDRFLLKYHRDKKELSVYVLTVGKGGPKITRSEADPNAPPRLLFTRLGTLPAGNTNMADFAGVMQMAVLDKPVLDQTGLSGKWDFTLTWTPDASQFIGLGGGTAPAPDPDAPPDLFTAIQQQLGLKLESTKAPAEVFVIDRVAKPSDN
jgi:uncharacterized protein (TIGR03435 family)